MKLISGSSGNNKLNGTDQDDLFLGLAGNDTLIGGAGTDAAWVSGSVAGYTFSSVAGQLVVRDVAPADGNDGIDTLSGIEQLRFGGGSLLTVSGGEFRVNTTTLLAQSDLNLVGLADGRFVATWTSIPGLGLDAKSFFQIFDPVGGTVGGEVDAAGSGDPLERLQPTVAALPDGGFVMFESQDFNGNGTDFDILGRQHDANGTQVRTLSAAASGQVEGSPAMAVLAGGGFAVVWQQPAFGPDNSGAVVTQLFSSLGSKVGVRTQVNTFVAGAQSQPDIAALADGGYVITWVSDGQDGSGNGVYAQRYDSGGSQVGGEFKVSDGSAGDQSAPSVVGLDNGGFVVVWQNSVGDGQGTSYGIVQSVYGVPGNSDFSAPVNRIETGDQKNPVIAALVGGGYVVAWESTVQDGSGVGIFAAKFDTFGNQAAAEFRVNTTTAGDQVSPSVTGLADGGFIVGWTSSDGDSTGVFAQRYDAAGNAVGLKLTGTGLADVLNVGDGQVLSVDGAGGNDTINGAATDDALYGGLGADQLKGNGGNDWLDGGAGNDTLTGGAGDDDYVVDAAGDVVTELAGGGTDTVHSAVSFVLTAALENLELTGATSINGTGNAGGNFITGNSGNNRIDGGAGGDVMAGRGGSDTYVVDSDADTVVENATDTGIDQIVTGIAVSQLADNVENLQLTGTAVTGNGNALSNDLQGNAAGNNMAGSDGFDVINGRAGNDTLAGGNNDDTIIGGLGNDDLIGGAGLDKFVFDVAPTAANLDHIDDFETGIDQLHLSASVFTTLVAQASLPGGALRAGAGFTTAGDADDRIIYNTTTGDLFYDRDGSAGPTAAVKFAVLDGAPALAASDFFVTN